MNCLVIGGTRFIGRMLVADLLKADHSVTVLHRRARHDLGRRVKNIVADRNDGQAMLPMVPGEPRQREFAFRAGVNIVMYTLTGNYKADQVHIPALLERLGQ